ncbi:MAG: SDR family NAD(P)-dependent oxidoreductase [Anaerolineales bacterium]|jgi:3-oxoacyl-[acyl-carrier protein] reductase|nr:SDR family NAD(P)-dependent oxidoreductase [Anaerolineales bacterium]
MPDLNGKVVLISGAGRGLGRELALALAAQGATIAANDISPLNVDEVARQISLSGCGQARVYLHDVAKKVAVQALVNQVVDDFGRIDILINSANVQPGAGLLEMDEWDLHRVFEVNTIGVFLLMQSAARVMRQQGGGLILNLLADPQPGLPAAYAASRQAVAELTRQTASELGQAGIRVYGLEKGFVVEKAAAIAAAILSLLVSADLPSGAILGPLK